MSHKKLIISSALIVLIFQAFSFLIGYLRDVIIANNFGASVLTDAWYIASNIPELLFKFLMFGALGASFIPVFIEFISNKKEKEGWHIASSVINFSALVLFFISLAGIFFSHQLVHFFAPGFNKDTQIVAVKLTRLLLTVLALMGINGFLMGIYRAYFNFLIPAICSVVAPLVLLIFIIIFSPSLGIYSLGWGTVAGFVLSFLVLLFSFSKHRTSWRPIIDFKHPQVKRIAFLMVPLIGAEIIGKGIGVVDRMFASTLASGSITSLFFANRLVMLPVSIFSVTFAIVVFPFLSHNIALEKSKEFKDNVFLAVKLSFLVVIPSLVGLIIFGERIIKMLFEHGKFTSYNSQTTYAALFYLSFGLMAYGLRPILARCFYALKKNWTLFKFELIGFTLNIIFDYILMKYMGLAGITLATSIVTLATVTYLVIRLKKELEFNFFEITPFIVKVGLAAIVMGLGGYIFNFFLVKFLSLNILLNQALSIVAIMLVCFSIFLGTLLLLKTEELDIVWKTLRKALGRK